MHQDGKEGGLGYAGLAYPDKLARVDFIRQEGRGLSWFLILDKPAASISLNRSEGGERFWVSNSRSPQTKLTGITEVLLNFKNREVKFIAGDGYYEIYQDGLVHNFHSPDGKMQTYIDLEDFQASK